MKEREGWKKIGAYYSPEQRIVIEGLVPMAIAPSIHVCMWTNCNRALRLYVDEGGWGHTEPQSLPEPWNVGESQTDTLVYLPVHSSALIFLSFFSFCMLANSHYISSLGIQSKYNKFSDLKKQFHLWDPWSPCRGVCLLLDVEMSVFKLPSSVWKCFGGFSHLDTFTQNTLLKRLFVLWKLQCSIPWGRS